MKNILFIALSIFTLSFQNKEKTYGVFEYEQIESRNKGFKSHIMFFDLILNKQYSTYTQKYLDLKDENYTQDDEEGVSDVIIVNPKKDEMKIVYNDLIKTKMFFKDVVAYNKVYVAEDNYSLKWVTSDEVRKFGNRTCYKATTTFRGRNYTAWYSKDLVTTIGPWKFSNVPGLIFEVYDDEKILHIKLKKINTKKQSNINSWTDEKIKKIITLEEFVALKKKEEDVFLERLNSKLPKGSKPFVKNKDQKQIELF